MVLVNLPNWLLSLSVSEHMKCVRACVCLCPRASAIQRCCLGFCPWNDFPAHRTTYLYSLEEATSSNMAR